MHLSKWLLQILKMKIVTCSKKIVLQSLFLILVLIDVGGCSPKVAPSFSSPSGPMRKHQFRDDFLRLAQNQKRKKHTQIIINIAHMPYFSVRYNPPERMHTFNFSLSKSIRTFDSRPTCICRAAKVVSENSSRKRWIFFQKKILGLWSNFWKVYTFWVNHEVQDSERSTSEIDVDLQ